MNVRILFVEDNADDAELMLRRLRGAGIDLQWQRVATDAELREALVGEPWQVALVDFNLRGFNGPRALELLTELAPDTPAITVSGAISEETAVATITAGAVDYVLKDNLTRLAPSVRRAVEGAELRREQRQAAAQARQSQFAIDHSSQAVVYVGADGTIQYSNAAAERLAGIGPAEAVGQKIWGWTPTIDAQRWAELWRAASQRSIIDLEGFTRLPDGEERLISATLDYQERAADSFVIIHARDITAQRAAEERAKESEALYRRIIETAREGIWAMDGECRTTFVNPQMAALLGYEVDEMLGCLVTDFVFEEDVAAQGVALREHSRMQLASQQTRLRRKDGAEVWALLSSTADLSAEGEFLGAFGMFTDVTGIRAAEEALRRRERELSTLVENAPDMIVRYDTELRNVYCNAAVERQLGVSPQTLLGKTPLETDGPRVQAELICQALRDTLATGTENRVEQSFVTPLGPRHFATLIVPERDDQGGIESLVAVTRDITEREQAEEALRRSEERFRRVSEATSDFAYSCVGPPGGPLRFDWLTGAVERITGWGREELFAWGCWKALVLEEDVPLFEERVIGLAPGDSSACELRIRDRQGGVRWLAVYSQAEPDAEDPEVHRLYGACQDITARKQGDEALRESEAQHRTILQTAQDGYMLVDMGGRLLEVNEAYCRMSGYSARELLAMHIQEVESVETAFDTTDHMREVVARGDDRFESRHVRKDGSPFDVEVSVQYRAADGGQMVAFLRDITARKRAEEELRQSEARLAAAQEVARVGSWETDLSSLAVAWSDETFRIFAVDRAGYGSTHPDFMTFVHPEDRAKVEAAFAASFDVRSPGAIEHRIVTPGGLVKHVEERWLIVADDQGRPAKALGTCQDITQRKLAEDEIRRQAEQLRRTVEGAVLAMSNVVETRDPYTAGHERRVAELAAAIAGEMGINGGALAALRLGGLIHDIGKIAVPAEILSKPGRLSEIELSLIKQHPATGFEILGVIDFGLPVAEMVLQHHERLDGSGYPKGLYGEDVLLEARILAVADVVEAMSSHRPYRAALGMEAALSEVREHAGVQYDAEVVAACVCLVEERSFQFTP